MVRCAHSPEPPKDNMSDPMKRLYMKSLVLALVGLTGCGSTPYFEAGAGYKINADWYLMPEHAGGRNPTAHFELGLEWDHGLECGLNHWSHYFDGSYNNRPETYKDEVICRKRWGGK
jgi:hypothetical protein